MVATFRRRAFTHGWSAIADSDPVFGRQFVLPTGLLSDFHPNTRASRLSPTRWWVKALRRNIAYQIT
ncbi:MAG: hypothetical protein LBC02_01990 [Planctomycetaceae bacterium]|nr:hypothetical protein [Planctomycetaceae bacterium]